jgi:hypothetical protein
MLFDFAWSNKARPCRSIISCNQWHIRNSCLSPSLAITPAHHVYLSFMATTLPPPSVISLSYFFFPLPSPPTIPLSLSLRWKHSHPLCLSPSSDLIGSHSLFETSIGRSPVLSPNYSQRLHPGLLTLAPFIRTRAAPTSLSLALMYWEIRQIKEKLVRTVNSRVSNFLLLTKRESKEDGDRVLRGAASTPPWTYSSLLPLFCTPFVL